MRFQRFPFSALLAPALLAGSASCLSAQAPGGGALPLETFAYDRAAPLELRDSLLRTEEGVEVRRISFASPRGGRAEGLLFVPRGRGPFAGVILGHGMPGNAEAFTGRALYIAKHGAVVVALTSPGMRRGGPPLTFTPADSADQVQWIVELQRAVDLLVARPDVDAARLAYVGRSYGGAMGALFAGVERRLKTYILAVADGGLVSHFTDPGSNDPPEGFPAPREQWDRWLAAMRPIEPIRFVGRAAPASIFFQFARQDQLVSAADAEEIQAAFPGEKTVTWYDTPHALNAQAHVDQLAWLSRTVGTTPPGPEDAAGPQIPPPPAPRPQE
ncbi:MAG TPA: hypothetical protein VHG91_20705 [Longimicrobium sp.]|nr:hypothetical protein [Longimicrobium sp.]